MRYARFTTWLSITCSRTQEQDGQNIPETASLCSRIASGSGGTCMDGSCARCSPFTGMIPSRRAASRYSVPADPSMPWITMASLVR